MVQTPSTPRSGQLRGDSLQSSPVGSREATLCRTWPELTSLPDSPPPSRPLFLLPILFYWCLGSTFFNASFDPEYWSWGLLPGTQTYSRQAPFSINRLCSSQQKLPKLIWPISYVLFYFPVTTGFSLKWPCLEYLIFVTQPNLNLLCKYLFWVITRSESGPIQFSEI